MAALKKLAVEWLQRRFFALPSAKNYTPKCQKFTCGKYTIARTILMNINLWELKFQNLGYHA